MRAGDTSANQAALDKISPTNDTVAAAASVVKGGRAGGRNRYSAVSDAVLSMLALTTNAVIAVTEGRSSGDASVDQAVPGMMLLVKDTDTDSVAKGGNAAGHYS